MSHIPGVKPNLKEEWKNADRTEKGTIISEWMINLAISNSPRHHNVCCRMCFREHVFNLLT